MADALNNGVFAGRLTTDPVIGTTKTGDKYAQFTLARDRIGSSKDNKKTDFIRFGAFGNQANFVENYFHKGDAMAVNYTVHSDSIEVAEGTRQTVFNFVVNNVAFMMGVKKSDAVPDATVATNTNATVNENSGDELPF